MNKRNESILLSIKPVYASLILTGKKTIELRKSFAENVKNARIYLYSTAPVKRIVGAFDVKSIRKLLIEEIDANIVKRACVDEKELHDYYKNNKTGTIIEIENPVEFNETIELSKLREMKHYPHNSHRKIVKGEKVEKILEKIYENSLKSMRSRN